VVRARKKRRRAWLDRRARRRSRRVARGLTARDTILATGVADVGGNREGYRRKRDERTRLRARLSFSEQECAEFERPSRSPGTASTFFPPFAVSPFHLALSLSLSLSLLSFSSLPSAGVVRSFRVDNRCADPCKGISAAKETGQMSVALGDACTRLARLLINVHGEISLSLFLFRPFLSSPRALFDYTTVRVKAG